MDVKIENVIIIGYKHYHIDDIVKITYNHYEEGEKTIIGRIYYIHDDCLGLDYSKDYFSNTMYVYYSCIKSIELG